MIRYMTPLAIATLAVALRGCPLELPGPLGLPVAGSIDKSLIGCWRWVGEKPDATLDILILPFSESEYYVEMCEPPVSSSGGESSRVTRYRAFASHVGTKMFLNAREVSLKSTDSPWFLATYSFPTPGELD